MSKSTIKKLLQSMTKAEIIEMVLELYSARKEAKEYLEFYACPDEKGKLEEYKSIIREEFYPKRRRARNGSSSWIAWNEVTNWSSRSSAMRCVVFGNWRYSWSFAG